MACGQVDPLVEAHPRIRGPPRLLCAWLGIPPWLPDWGVPGEEQGDTMCSCCLEGWPHYGFSVGGIEGRLRKPPSKPAHLLPLPDGQKQGSGVSGPMPGA